MNTEMVIMRAVMAENFRFSDSLYSPYVRVRGQRMQRIMAVRMIPRPENMSSLMYELLYSTEILSLFWKNILQKSIVCRVLCVGDTIAFWEKYYGKCDSMSSNVNLFTIVNLIFYTRVRVRIGWQNY
jgi:hypothetical protein